MSKEQPDAVALFKDQVKAIETRIAELDSERAAEETKLRNIYTQIRGLLPKDSSDPGWISAGLIGKKRGRPKGSGKKKFKRGTGKYKPTDEEVAEAINEHPKVSDKDLAKNLKESNKWAVRADRIARIRKESVKKK